MFRGFATISFYSDDLAAARDWYTALLGIEPYYAFPPPPRTAGLPGIQGRRR